MSTEPVANAADRGPQVVHGRVDAPLYDRLVAYAERTRRSRNAALNVLLERGLDAEENHR